MLLIIFITLIYLISKEPKRDTVINLTSKRKVELHSQTGDKSCSWQFIKYVPSAWETEWYSNIETFQYEVCSVLSRSDQINKTIAVLLRIMSLQKTLFNEKSETTSVDVDFSQMHYANTCNNQITTAVQFIEPLIGFIRDPLTICPKIPSVPRNLYLEGESAIQSKRFLLLAPSSPFKLDKSTAITTIPPWLYTLGYHKILIDIGSSYFQSRNGNTAEIGTKWFYDYFTEKSIRFDRIIAFEYKPLDTKRAWDELPDDVFPIYTFINVGVEEKEGKFNPWTMLHAIAKPEDYVVLKLDIDTPPLESALMKQLLVESNTARYLIDELFFEKHVSDKRHSTEDKLKDSYDLFTKLRQAGIRMHGWP